MDFGETEEVTAEFDNEICYTGAVYDETTGLYYMNARYYDPEAGRFISPDTIDGPQYDLIRRQFECIFEYLNWDMRFYIPVSADKPEDLKADEASLAKIKEAISKIY